MNKFYSPNNDPPIAPYSQGNKNVQRCIEAQAYNKGLILKYVSIFIGCYKEKPCNSKKIKKHLYI